MERSSSYNAMTTIALLEIERILPAAHFDSQGLRTTVKSTFAQRQNGFKPFLIEDSSHLYVPCVPSMMQQPGKSQEETLYGRFVKTLITFLKKLLPTRFLGPTRLLNLKIFSHPLCYLDSTLPGESKCAAGKICSTSSSAIVVMVL